MPPFETTVSVRYRDLDPMGHVNNAVYASYLESARNDFFRDVLGEELADTDAVLASLSLDFRAPVESGDDVTVAVWIPEVGETSCTFAYEVRANGEQAATGETVLVTLDDDGSPIPLPDRLRSVAADYAEPPASVESAEP